MEKPESCPTCSRYTLRGLQTYHEQHKPLYGTDFTKPIAEQIEEVRRQLVRARGQCWDIGFRYTGWTERMNDVEGLLTCGLVALHRLKVEAEEHAKLWAERDAAARAS